MPLLLLIFINSTCGLFIPGTYARETYNWYAQAVGQDMVDLFLIAPLLLITSILAYRGNRTALSLWAGVNGFILYTYVLYCFDVHFNYLFLVYCGALGLSFYSLIYFLIIQLNERASFKFNLNLPVRTIGIFFITMACLFYLTWLKEILPAIAGGVIPGSIKESGAMTNPVHVLDISVLLPSFIITAVLLLRKKITGAVLAPVLLTFCTLMCLSISILIVVMKIKGLAGDWPISFFFDFISLFSLALLILFIKNNK